MSTELESAKYYREPTAEELSAAEAELRGGSGRIRSALRVACYLFWVVFFGGSCYVAFHALRNANQVAQSSAHGGTPAMSMMSYVMNLVDMDWDRNVEQHVRKNVSAVQLEKAKQDRQRQWRPAR